ncbi:MAG TPA: transketolase [Elusimicrobia bacterium]|nr:transketolase [Elusimicrobiota bacterium]HBT62246.1 transketolase [Elusimicrobiota bacterium]
MRTAFFKTLEELAAKEPRINLITGDLGFTVVEPYAERFPLQFLNAGVAEQNMTGLAVGMALSGKIVFTYSIANFPTLRCIEQIRNDACYHKANVKVTCVGGGLAYGALGSSHQATEDIAIMRSLPGMTVVAPGDPVEAEQATRAIAAFDGPCYLRLGKAGEPPVHRDPIDFKLGKAIRVRDGKDITIISTGGMLHPCFEAASQLEQAGLSARLLSMHTIKPIDVQSVLSAAQETSAILTVEEHSVIGGLGSAVAEILAQQSSRRIEFRIMGLPDQFCRTVGSQDYLRQAFKLSPEAIKLAATELIRRTDE